MNCQHEFKTYVGFTDSFEYCVKCDLKKSEIKNNTDIAVSETGTVVRANAGSLMRVMGDIYREHCDACSLTSCHICFR